MSKVCSLNVDAHYWLLTTQLLTKTREILRWLKMKEVFVHRSLSVKTIGHWLLIIVHFVTTGY